MSHNAWSDNQSPQLSFFYISSQLIINKNECPDIHMLISDPDSDWVTLTFHSSNSSLITPDSFTINNKIITNIPIENDHENDVYRKITIIPATDLFGVSLITLTLTDDQLASFSKSFTLVVNSPPEITLASRHVYNQGGDNMPMSLTVIDKDTDFESLSYTIESSNPDLIDKNDIHLTATHIENDVFLYDVTFDISPDQIGASIITIGFKDNNASTKASFELFVNQVPDILVSHQLIMTMNGPSVGFPITIMDYESGLITVTIQSTNNEIIRSESIDLNDSQSQNLLINVIENEPQMITALIISETDQFGYCEIIITVSDQYATVSQPIGITINAPPGISSMPNCVVNMNTSESFSYTIYDPDTFANTLSFRYESANQDLIPNDHIQVTSILIDQYAQLQIMQVTPINDMGGLVSINMYVNDGQVETLIEFSILVNTPPQISAESLDSTPEDTPLNGYFNIFDDQGNDDLSLMILSSNSELIPVNAIQWIHNENSYTATFSPLDNQYGVSDITIIATDTHGLSDSKALSLLVISVYDPPLIVPINDQTTIENTPISIDITINDPDTPSEHISLTASLSNPLLISELYLPITATSETRILTLTPVTNEVGSTIVTLLSYDGANSDMYSFTLSVLQINESPEAIPMTIVLKEDMPISYSLLFEDTDSQTFQFSIVSQPTKGVVTLTDPIQGIFEYQPNNNETGLDQFEFKVFDGQRYSNIALVKLMIQPVNDPPIAFDCSFNIRMAQIEGTKLSFSWLEPDNDPVEFEIMSKPRIGRIDDINNEKGTFLFIPQSGFIGIDTFTYRVLDKNKLASEMKTITVNVKSDNYFIRKIDVDVYGYQPGCPYRYYFINAETSKETRTKEKAGEVISEELLSGIYRLFIIGDGYHPYEYRNDENPDDPTRIYLDEDMRIQVQLTYDPQLNLHPPEVTVMHSFFDDDNDDLFDGFNLYAEPHNITETMKVIIGDQVMTSSSGVFSYTWTPAIANATSVSTANYPREKDVSYTVTCQFYTNNDLIKTYHVLYKDYDSIDNMVYDKSQEQMNIENNQNFGGVYGEPSKYISQCEHEFYPLLGTSFTIRVRDAFGEDTPLLITIPKLSLDYLFIDNELAYDNYNDVYTMDTQANDTTVLSPIDRIKISVTSYTFLNSVGNAMSLHLSLANGPQKGAFIRYNPYKTKTLDGRDETAPPILIPLLLNRNYNNIDDFTDALMELLNKFPTRVSEKGDGKIDTFHDEKLSFIRDNKTLVHIRVNHLSTFGISWNPSSMTHKESFEEPEMDSIDNSGCFIQVLNF